MDNQPRPQPLWSPNFVRLLVGCLFLFIPYSLYLPIMPTYLLEKLHGSLQTAGAVNAAFLLSLVLFRSQTVRLEARFGVRRVLLTSCLLFMLTNLVYLYLDSVIGVMAIRGVSGALFAVLNTSLMALGSRMVPMERKGEGLAYLTTMMTTGGAIGPYFGLTLSRSFGYPAAFLFSALAALIGLLLIRGVCFDEQRPQVSPRISFHDLFEVKAVPVSLVILILAFPYGAVLTFVVLFAGELHLAAAAKYFFIAMASASVATRLLTGRMYDRFGPNVAIFSAILILTAGMLTLGATRTVLGLLSAAALIGMGHGIGVPSIQALAIQVSPHHRTSAVTATFFTCLDGGIGLGAYLLAGSIHAFGYSAVYLALSGVTASCLPVFYLIHTRKHTGGKRYGNKEDGSLLHCGKES